MNQRRFQVWTAPTAGLHSSLGHSRLPGCGGGGVAWGLAHLSPAHPPTAPPPRQHPLPQGGAPAGPFPAHPNPWAGRTPCGCSQALDVCAAAASEETSRPHGEKGKPVTRTAMRSEEGPRPAPRGWSGRSCCRSAAGSCLPPASGALLLSWLHQDSAAGGQPHPSEEEGLAAGTGRGQSAHPLGLYAAATARMLTGQGPPSSGPRLVRRRVDHHHTRDTPGADSSSGPRRLGERTLSS